MTPKTVIISLIEVNQFIDAHLPQFCPDELKMAYLDRLLFQAFHPSHAHSSPTGKVDTLSISASILLQTGLTENAAIELESHIYKLVLDHLAVIFKHATYADLSQYQFVINQGWDLYVYIPITAYREDLHGALYSPNR